MRPPKEEGDMPEATGSVEPHDRALVDQLAQVWGSIAALGGELDETDWKRPTEVPGWSVQDNLTHVVGMEWSLLGVDPPEHVVPDELPHVKNDVGRLNEVFVDSRRGVSGAEALAEFRDATTRRLAQLRSYGPDDFAADSWTPTGPGSVRDLLPFRIFDSWVHEQDMRRAVGQPGNLDSAAAQTALERVVGTMPYVVGKKAGAPDGSSVVFELSGPLARSVAIGVEGRARLLDAAPDEPTVRIVTDVETFTRLAVGRLDPVATLATGSVRCSGDEGLGSRVVEQINFLF
jgi:uncharacterized protein (TIGR03083 family)